MAGRGGLDVVTEKRRVSDVPEAAADFGGFLLLLPAFVWTAPVTCLLPDDDGVAACLDEPTSPLDRRHRLGRVDEKLGRCIFLFLKKKARFAQFSGGALIRSD